jgi:hypothetical protein
MLCNLYLLYTKQNAASFKGTEYGSLLRIFLVVSYTRGAADPRCKEPTNIIKTLNTPNEGCLGINVAQGTESQGLTGLTLVLG